MNTRKLPPHALGDRLKGENWRRTREGHHAFRSLLDPGAVLALGSARPTLVCWKAR